MNEAAYGPGSLVTARGREWIVLAGSSADVLFVRPISGSEEDQTRIHLALEADPVREARFPLPLPEPHASHDAALLLRDALLLSLRRGAGPFRSFGQISVQPRAYQLVPLMMALKLDPVRLLVADDVGVGKTIEAALIARELLDRGDIDRIAVLCPPHLVDQWVTELEDRFHIHAVPVTAASAARLERNLPPSESIFSAHPHTVVSLDYIKSEKRRADFLRACPEFVIVDEAHTCAATSPGRHQRFELLKGLTESPERHLVLLTATPHSGDEDAYHRLLGLLDREFGTLGQLAGAEKERLRERLARHFVQRRRPDIEAWQEQKDGKAIFPRRKTMELTYKLTGAYEAFFHAVLDYCRERVTSAGGDERRQRLNFWGTLALLRCTASSPAAAALALRTRAGLDDDDDGASLRSQLFDGDADGLSDDDLEPATGIDDPALASLVARANDLAAKDDPKLAILTVHLKQLLKDGYNPVVFCRYIATAHYLHGHLKGEFPSAQVSVVTGENSAADRLSTVEELGDSEGRRLLVATDCLSEGVNLQHSFDAVVHYDLSWNPTRHEQREGRVDRFQQPREEVRCTLLYGANNPVDGVVLDVILRKAERIRKETGVPVPLPDTGPALTQALLQAVLIKRREVAASPELPLRAAQKADALEKEWEDAADKARANRTVFAQRRLRPDEVLPELHRTLAAMGGKEDAHRFADRALSRLGSGLEPVNGGFKVPLAPLPEDVQERLDAEGLSGTLKIQFDQTTKAGFRGVLRSHPLIAVLAESLLERTLAAEPGAAPEAGILGRAGCWVSSAVTARTLVALVRLRHQLVSQKGRRSRVILVEEASAVAWGGADAAVVAEGDAALDLLRLPPAGDPPLHVRDRVIRQALEQLAERGNDLTAFANRRAEALLVDHERVRESSRARGSTEVRALLPADVVALYVLLPKVA